MRLTAKKVFRPQEFWKKTCCSSNIWKKLITVIISDTKKKDSLRKFVTELRYFKAYLFKFGEPRNFWIKISIDVQLVIQ